MKHIRKNWRRFAAVLLSAALMISTVSQTAFAAGADTGKAIQFVDGGTAANISGGQASSVYFGTYPQNSAGSGGYHTDPNESGDVHTHCVCGGNGDVNGHEHDTAGTEWTEWTPADSLPDSAGSYYLTQSVSGSWTVPTGEVNLCLNGQTISGSITVGSGAKLTLTDCTGTGKLQGSGSGSGVSINGGTFNLYGGTITGFVNGVEIGSHNDIKTGSSFTMYGGAITSNEAGSSAGGGVFLVGTTNHADPPSFTMHGGTISNNTAGASDGGGGGVYVGEKCSFTMDGGTITGNTATAGNGGGIYIHFNAGNVSISNATITGNKASATGNTSYGHGGGIYSQRGVTVKNVTITGNNSTYEGGGIYGKGAITLADATVTGNNRYDVYYDGEEKTTPELTVSGSVQAGYYANYDWKLPILVSGALSEDSVIRVGVREGIKPNAGGSLLIAEPASGVILKAENFQADAADSVTSLGEDGKVYLSLCDHEMDDTGYICKKCHTQFDARIGESAYYQTLTEAFSAVRDSTVTLLRDVTLTGNCSAAYNFPATLDLNGKTVSSEKYDIRVGGGNNPNTLTVKDSGTGGGTQALTVKFLVYSNGTLAVDNSYTGEISRVELQAGGALERFGGKIGELVLSNAASGSTSTGYGLKLWKGNTNACTIGGFTDNTTSKSLTVNDLLGTDYAKCELYGEQDGTWSIVDKSTKIVDLTGYTAYKVQFAECVHACSDDTAEKPVCSKCGKALVVKITATASDGKTRTAWFPADSGIENGDGYVEAIQTLNGWSAEGYTDATLMPLCDVHNNSGGIGIASVTLTGKLAVDGGEHLIYSTTVAAGADVTFKTGQFYHITVNGKASFVGGTYRGLVTAAAGAEAVFSGGAYQYLEVEDGGTAVVKNSAAFGEDVKVTKGTLTVEGGSFGAAVAVEGDGTMNVNGGSFTGTGRLDRVTYGNGAKGTVSGGSFAELYLYGSGTAWLAGGSFTKLSTASSGVLSSLLADGAAYYDQSGNAISGSAVSELNDVTVKTHAHTVDEQTGICSVCQKQMAASLTAGNETSWYLTLDAAIAAANEGNGEKTLKLYQDVTTTAPSYELTRGPVTLDVNGKKAQGGTITVKGIQLTVTGEGTIWGVTASGSSAVVKNSTVKINYITAENGGRLELGGGSYMGLTVKNDGSSASLSGGTYKKIEWGNSYVPANEYLADGYGYKTSDGTWKDGTASVDNVTVTPAPIKSTKVYPNSETDYSGSTFDAKDSTSVTLTVSVTSDESAGLTYTWYRSINDEWRSLTNPYITQGLTEKYTGADSQTLSITELPAGQTFSYKVQIATGDGYKCFSKPFTVTRHQHSWTYTASGATITATCQASGCPNANGGSVTIAAPAELTYNGSGKAAVVTASGDDWQGPAVSDISIGYIKMGKYGPETLETGALPTNVGTYTASITLGEGDKAATANVEYTIQRADPKASDFTFAAPSPLTYDGNAKTATVEPNTGINGMGAVTVKYFKNGAETEPKDAGDYTVKVSVAEGANYNATTDDLTTDGWKFTIGKATQTITVPTDKTIVKDDIAEDISDWATVAGVTGGSNPGTLSYALNGQAPEGVSLTGNQLTVQPTCTAAQFTIKVTAAETDNYNAAEGTFTVTVVDKATADVTITGLPQTVTYGQKFTLTASQTGDTGTSGKWSWDCNQEYFKLVESNANTKTITLQAIKAGTPSKGITATYESGTHKGSATVNAVVEKKEVTVSGITAENKEYDGGTTATVNASGATITGIVSGDSLTITATGTFADADVGNGKAVNLTLGALSGASAGNYKLAASGNQTTATANITAKNVSISVATVNDKDYDGNANATVPSVTITGVSSALSMGTDFDVTSATFPDADADTANVDVTINVALKGTAANNYNLTNGMGYVVTSAAKINKATYSDSAPTKTVNILKNYAGVQTGTLTAADFFTTAPAEAKITNAVPNADSSNMMSNAGADASGNFTYASQTSITAASNENWTITISSKNYTDITATLTFKLVDKTDAGVTISSVPASKTYGESFTLTASVTDAGTGTGSWTWTSNDPSVLQVTGTGASATVKALKAGSATISAKYESDTTMGEQTTAPITVGKRVITVTADNKSMTVNGTLPTFTVTYGNLPSGVQAADIFGTLASASTTTDGKTTGSFDITVTTPVLKAEAGANYEVGAVTKGTLTVNPRSSSGGGGGSSVSTYSVTVGKTENGSVSVSPKSASKGDTVTITVTPDKGYVLETLTVLDKNDKEIKLTEENGKYTFTMPVGKVEVKVTFMDDNTMLNYFVDVKVGDYFYDAVLWAAEKGITSGTDATHFSPNAACTRAQIVTFLWRAAGSPEPKNMSSFTDVPADSYYAKAVAWAVKNGITGGTGDGKFSPDAPCTRAQMATFLWRANGSPKVTGTTPFSDVSAGTYYCNAVLWAYEQNITNGTGGGKFSPDAPCTRAQMVQMLKNASDAA
ncbi:S-layer homology domain-containing protein [Flavonifractor plautii]|uniref:S-layer homology domain-containing protein n=1 Tax=Flavonifractor plautii TaxID=292800 RepID=UPI001896E73F|nr:S-layer homology domain-containing protein [Flavonifractor plautii]